MKALLTLARTHGNMFWQELIRANPEMAKNLALSAPDVASWKQVAISPPLFEMVSLKTGKVLATVEHEGSIGPINTYIHGKSAKRFNVDEETTARTFCEEAIRNSGVLL